MDGPGAAATAVQPKLDGGDAELRHHLADVLNAAISAFEASARARFEDAAQGWARRLDEQAAGQAREAAAYFRRCLRTTPKDEDLAALNDLAARFAGLQASLTALDTSSDGMPPETRPRSRHAGRRWTRRRLRGL